MPALSPLDPRAISDVLPPQTPSASGLRPAARTTTGIVADRDLDRMGTAAEVAPAVLPPPARTVFLSSGSVPGPHAIPADGESFLDEHAGTLGQSHTMLRDRGYFSANGASPLCGTTSLTNAITKLRRDWGLATPHEGQVEEMLFLLERFLPMLGLDPHQDAVDHGFASRHFERVMRAYIRDQLRLTPAVEWIRPQGRVDQMTAALREAHRSGMIVAGELGNHWILISGHGPEDRFSICDPNYPRPMWSEKISVVPGARGGVLRSPSYSYCGFMGIGARGPAPEDSARIRWKRGEVELELSVAPDGWARLEARHPSGLQVSRRDFVKPESVKKLERAVAASERGPLDAALTELGTAQQRNAREAIEEMTLILLGTESPPFREINLRIGDRHVHVEGGEMGVELNGERRRRRLNGLELELLAEGVRTAKLRPTGNARVPRVPEHLPVAEGAGGADFSLRIQSARSKVHNCHIGCYSGSTSGQVDALGEYRERLGPLIAYLDSLSSSSPAGDRSAAPVIISPPKM